MSGNAWVTLATNDSYALGTLVLASSLRAVGTTHQLAVMVTRGVSPEMKEQLRSAFDLLFEVNILDSQDEVNLSLLSRPELGLTFTKLHCWRLTQFQKCVFMDADTMVVRNCDELFDREELSAAPDAGWPDCFNSGVFVYRPSLETFRALLSFAVTHGSFDGGDQGLLNSFFADWATKDIAFHLPFIYNMCSNAVYSYLPAYKNYGDSVKIVHFIGPNKPWLMHFDVETGCVHPPAGFHHVLPLLQKWWDIFFASVHSRLSSTMARQDTPTVSRHVADSTMGLHSQPDEDFCYGHWDPWETIDLEQTVSLQHVPPTNNHLPHQEPAVHHVEHIEPMHTLHSPHFVAFNHAHDTNAHDKSFSSGDLHNGDSGGGGLQNIHIVPVIEHDASSKSVAHDVPHNSVVRLNNILCKTNSGLISENKNSPKFASSPLSESHGTLLHSAAQDSMPPSTAHLADPCLAMHVVNSDAPVVCARITSQGECLVDETAGSSKASDPSPRNAGLAGAFAQLRLGAPRSDAQTALEEHLRRQNWEQGQADYMGSDSFDNIWNKICTTLSAAPGKPSRIKSTDEQATENKTEAVVEGEEPKVETTVAKSTEASVSPTAASDSPIVSLQEKQSSVKASDQVVEVAQPLAPASSGTFISTVALPFQSASTPAALQSLASAVSLPASTLISIPTAPASPPVTTQPPPASPPVATQPPPASPPVVTQPLPASPPVATQPLPASPPVATQPLPASPPVATQPLPASPPVATQPLPASPPVATQPLPASPPVATQPLPASPTVAAQPLPASPPVVAQPPPASPPVVTQPPPASPPVVTQPPPASPPVVTQPPPASPPVVTQPPPASPSVTSLSAPVSPKSVAQAAPHPAPPSSTKSSPAAAVLKASPPVDTASSVPEPQASKVASPCSPVSSVDVPSGAKTDVTPPASETAAPVPPKRRGPHKAATSKDASKSAAAQPAKTSKPSPKGKK